MTVGILLIVALVVVILSFSKGDTKLLQKAGTLDWTPMSTVIALK